MDINCEPQTSIEHRKKPAIIIAVIGKTASGKSTMAKFAREKLGFSTYEIGNYVRLAYKDCDAKISMLDYANQKFLDGKLTVFVKNAIHDACKVENNIMFLGMRSKEEIECIKQVFPHLIIIQISSRCKNREKRYTKLDQDKVSLQTRDYIEDVWSRGLKDIKINYRIYNNGSIEEFKKNIYHVIQQIRKNEREMRGK